VIQNQGESVKDFLNQFGALVVQLHTQDEALIVHAFVKGIRLRPFIDSLIRDQPRTLVEIKRRAVAHIAAEEWMSTKLGSMGVGPTKARENSCTQPLRVHETTTEKKSARQTPYESRENQPRSRSGTNPPPRPKFKMPYRELLVISAIAEKLESPPKSNKVLEPRKNIWCEFHKAYGHGVEKYLALHYQFSRLLKEGLIHDYVQGDQEGSTGEALAEEQRHEVPIHGEIHTISRGFSRGGCIA